VEWPIFIAKTKPSDRLGDRSVLVNYQNAPTQIQVAELVEVTAAASTSSANL
jgi:hypothetical protein